MSSIDIKKYEIDVNRILADILNKYISQDSKIKASMVYSLMDGGKRIRPLLFILILEAYQIDYKKYEKIIAAIEMIHTYSLVHDDLPALDNDIMRRNKPTTHIKFDEATAILCGDALLTDAFYLLSILDLDSELVVKIIRTLSLASGSSGMIYGQALDLEEYKKDINELERINYFKTAHLIQASLVVAALIAGKEIDDFVTLGAYLGQAFQIQDDILELTKSSLEIGKSNQSDIDNNKQTIASIVGLNNAQVLVENYFDHIDEILIKHDLYGTAFHLLIIEIANREK